MLRALNCDVFIIVAEPQVPFRRKLQDVEVQEKKSAMLMCEVPLSATQTNWFMEETRLEQNSKYYMEQEGTLRRLTIRNVTTNDDGVYICEMKEGSRTVAELTVRGMVNELNYPTVQICCIYSLGALKSTFTFQATLLRSFPDGRWFLSATPSSSAWSWSTPAWMPTGPATARS